MATEPPQRPQRFSPYRFLVLRAAAALFALWLLVFLPLSVLPLPELATSWEELPHLVRGGVRLFAMIGAVLLLSGWFFRAGGAAAFLGLVWLASYGRVDELLAGQAALACLALSTYPGPPTLRLGAPLDAVPATGRWLRIWSIGVLVVGCLAAVWAVASLFGAFGFVRFVGVVFTLCWWALAALDERWIAPVDDHESIVYFDGVCAFCQGSVRLILSEEQRPRLRFAPLQGTAAGEQLRDVALRPHGSLVFTSAGRVFVGSDAALRVARAMGGVWRLLFVFELLPKRFRDALYDWFASNRYRWFGRTESCFVPSPEQRSRFLD